MSMLYRTISSIISKMLILLALCGLMLALPAHAESQNTERETINVYNAGDREGQHAPMETNPITNKAKREESSWVLSLYTGANCDDDYYFIEGNNVKDPAKCLNLIGGIESTYTDSGVFCKYYTDGGFDSVSCKSSIAVPIRSWRLKGGICLTSEHNCTASGGGGMLMRPTNGCQKTGGDLSSYITVESLRCFSHW